MPPARQQSPPPPPSPPESVSPVALAQTAETQPNPRLIGVRGWLLLLCIQLTILSPLVTIGQIARLFQQLAPSFQSVAGLESFFVFVMVVTLVFLLASISVGVMLWSRRSGSPNFVRWFLLSTFAWLCLSPYTIYLFVRMPPGAVPGILAAALPELVMGFVVTFAWYYYLLKSKRVLANFGPAAQPARAGTSSRPAVATHLARSNEGKTSKGEVISIPKTAGILIALSAFCVIFLAITTRQFDDGPRYATPAPGYENSVAAKSGRAVGHGITIFVLAAIGAAIGRLVTLKARGDSRYSAPVVGGVIVALVVTAMTWIGADADRFVGGSMKRDISSLPEKEVAPKSIEELVEAQRRRIRCDASDAAALAGLEELRRRRRVMEGGQQDFKAIVLPRPDGQDWHRIALPEGIALEIPTNWIVTGTREREAIDAMGKALFPNSALKGRMGLGATLHGPGGKIQAQVGIRFYLNSAADDIHQADLDAATWEEIQQLDEKLRKGQELSSPKLSSWQGTRREKAGEFTSLLSEYAARFAHESFDRCFVRVRVYDGKLSFSLLLNYEESLGLALRPTIDRIISTLARAT